MYEIRVLAMSFTLFYHKMHKIIFFTERKIAMLIMIMQLAITSSILFKKLSNFTFRDGSALSPAKNGLHSFSLKKIINNKHYH